MAAAVRPYLANGGMPARAGRPLDEVIDAAADAAGAGLLIMLDQFEEYFVYRAREPVAERFADELAGTAQAADLRGPAGAIRRPRRSQALPPRCPLQNGVRDARVLEYLGGRLPVATPGLLACGEWTR